METVEFLQQLDHPVIYWLMRLLSFLGDEPFYFLLLPVVLWCWDARRALPLTVILMGSIYLNFVLKNLFGLHRPVGTALIEVSGFGFPSGHAQHAVVLWGFLAQAAGKHYFPAAALVFFIGLSRIYLGVHFPADVVSGWSIGFVWLMLALYVLSLVKKGKTFLSAVPAVGVVFMITLWMALFYPTEESIMVSGILFGLIGGIVLERRFVRYFPVRLTVKQVIRIILGIISVILVKACLDVLVPATPVCHYIQYAVLGIWISLVVPTVFVRMGVSGERPEASSIDSE